jgi:hypothetical protein
LDVNLDEGAGQLLFLPWRGGLAGAQPDDHVFPAHRLSWVQRYVLDDSVALVEDSKHRDALRHRRDPAFSIRRRSNLPPRGCGGILFGAPATRGQGERDQQRSRRRTHVYSGIQGS